MKKLLLLIFCLSLLSFNSYQTIVKMYVKGNYFFMEVGTELKTYHKSKVHITKPEVNATIYSVRFDRAIQQPRNIEFTDIRDINDAPFATQADFDTWIETNTGFNPGGGTGNGGAEIQALQDSIAVHRSEIDQLTGDLFEAQAANEMQSAVIVAFLGTLEIEDVVLGGSTSNAANQEFFVPLDNVLFEAGTQVELTVIQFRGDFSGANEFVDIALDTPTNPTTSIGAFASTDTNIFLNQIPEDLQLFPTVVDNNGQNGIFLYFSPSPAVNFAVAPLTNTWEIRSKIKRL